MEPQLVTKDIANDILRRYSGFGDGVVNSVLVDLQSPCRRCVISVSGLMPDGTWADVTLRALDVTLIYWYQRWLGPIECGELILKPIRDMWYVGVGGVGANEDSVDLEITDTSLLIVCKRVEYSVGPYAAKRVAFNFLADDADRKTED